MWAALSAAFRLFRLSLSTEWRKVNFCSRSIFQPSRLVLPVLVVQNFSFQHHFNSLVNEVEFDNLKTDHENSFNPATQTRLDVCCFHPALPNSFRVCQPGSPDKNPLSCRSRARARCREFSNRREQNAAELSCARTTAFPALHPSSRQTQAASRCGESRVP